MLKETVISHAVRIVCAGGVAAALSVASQSAIAQDAQGADAQIQRVEVTGSSIKRIAAEGALPVTILTAEAIRTSGATSVTDLVKKLSSAQGATTESSSVGGSTFGFSGISVHNVGETRTLVLLNGKRLAQFGGQTLTGFAAGFDLNSIPISAIQRVELLTDGASALYGADAIAGVVNFITKHDTTEGDVSIGYSAPKNGAREKRISATKGFGNLEDDGYNVVLTFGHDERDKLGSVDRSFASTGKVQFSANGKRYQKQQFSASPIPANATDDQGQLISPYQKTNGSCPDKTFRVIEPYNDGSGLVDDYCGYDFVKDLEIYPERKRDNFMASGTFKIAGQEVYADVLLSRTKQTSRIAPVPGAIAVDAGTALHNKYLLPIGITGDSTAFYRLFDMGQRTSKDTADFASVVVGTRGVAAGWDYNASYNFSESRVKGSISGYPGAIAVNNLTSSGLLDPFVGPGKQSTAAQEAIKAATFSGYWDGGTSRLQTINLNASTEVRRLPGGAMMLGVGANINREEFSAKPSPFAQGILADPVKGTLCGGTTGLECDQRFGDAASSQPYSASRTSKGVFGELIAPVLKELELGAALRFDEFSDFGGATTAKASFKWTPAPTLLIRGSVGNGFHAPTVPQVNALQRGYGVTSDKYTCTPALQAIATRLNAQCQPGNRQYDQLAGGNRDLQPEKSKQATIGFRYEPISAITLGADLWHVQIRDSFGQLTEQLVFANPANFPKSWGVNKDVGTGTTYLAFLADNQNLGKSFATGVDIDISGRYRSGIGLFTSQLNATRMLREDVQLERNGQYYSALGNFADLGTVTFRTRGQWTNTLKTGNWANSLTVNFLSGYKDQETTVDVLDASGAVTGQEKIRMQVGFYSTLDWQTVWTPSKSWVFTAGVLNLTDKSPPFVPSTAGANRGQQFGYDDRYYDPRGRTGYLNASYKF
ncbi:TonB-dependent receptor plug domain-containing protein [Janthinobacterium sp. FT14W]|uniref:TonB-dependent receptor plug domain-containing protein n=1 Tax=Janthinobacterium sp. FT14W TaxID=2654253 RepID=UPI0012659ABC|nr:TonB-dependent receptor [Janthinobacterium sp. FT14W]KAB8059966.1 TonB-dependent receptor plug domain-containing protein [Janthinobacterium sp. FT14W]